MVHQVSIVHDQYLPFDIVTYVGVIDTPRNKVIIFKHKKVKKSIDNITPIDGNRSLINMNILTNYLEQYFDEVGYKEFYRDIFPMGSLENKSEYVKGKYNGIIVEVTNEKKRNGKPKVLRHTLTDDLDKLDEVCSRDNFCLMSPISYAGKTRDSSMARELYALAFDLDGIQTRIKDKKEWPYGLANFFHQVDNMKILPRPTYVVSSGTGLHLYYVLEKSIPLFVNVVEQLEALKKELTRMMWHDSISKLVDEIQYEPVCQGFRMVGTITKKGERVRAFETGTKVTIEYLNGFVRDEYKVKEFTYKSDLTLDQAKNKYPEWYQKRIIEKKGRGTWTFNRAVYDKWLERLPKEAKLGHRYWSMWVLAVTAMKCGITQKELENDAFGLIEVMNEKDINKENPFTEEDVLSALEGYDSAWLTYPVEKMAYRSDIPIQKNKRNGRKQELHLKLCRASLEVLNEANGKSLQGRKPYKHEVSAWRDQFPFKSKAECIRETGLSKPTVYKWWDWHDGIEPEEWEKMILEIEEEIEDMKSKGIEMEAIPWE